MIHLDNESLRQLQMIELELLLEVDRICKKCGIHYNIIAGTMLGAVRHGGFIPWDDDADVAFLRPEYERFRAACRTELDTGRFYFQDHTVTSGYRWGYGKLRRKGTIFLREHQEHMPYEQGVFIDIFPLDAVPEDEAKLQTVLKSVRRTTRFLKAKDTPILLSGRIGLLFRKWRCKWAVKKQGWNAIYQKGVDDMLRSTSLNDCRYVAELGYSGTEYLLDKHIFDGTVMLDFEQVQVPAPAGFEQYLRTQYGEDYMTPRQIATAHDDAILDTERSYTELMPLARRQYKKKQLRKLFKG